MTEPDVRLEVERSYEVPDGAALPRFTEHPLVISVSPPEVSELTALYFDTEDLQLGRQGSALRYRTGGHDAGWHLKTRVARGHQEAHWSVAPNPDGTPPAEIMMHLSTFSLSAELRVIASILTQRTSQALTLSGAANPVVELADDRVQSVDERTGDIRLWREWELELLQDLKPHDATAVMDALEVTLREAGATPSPAASKLHRALGLDRSD